MDDHAISMENHAVETNSIFDHAHPSIANETVVNSAVSIKKIETKLLYLDRDFARGFTFFRKKHSMDNHAV